ncbi:sel1 repeat family protein [Sulfitobacter sp. SK012]|uniref:tetratricopeptide repeat protein n=1 Tax=Sulfitobacter sp. SK012 TaxID=1389005 RepID=UPI000E0BB621|nr:tetratricopeptide repeat protein [Sulfitobacter sp. SK012]AXI45099.1 sel1 repeat family protein [Sulfitobacter sp. SK012]
MKQVLRSAALAVVLSAVGLAVVLAFSRQPTLAQDFQKGLDAARSGDFETALQELRPLAEQGYPPAQYNIGVLYYDGNGVPQDFAEAEKWLRLAAEQGYVSAQYNLGLMYDKGDGVPQDIAEAVKWLRLAAEQGNAESQMHLGLMYVWGDGVIQDNVYAHMWWDISASLGYEDAKGNRDIVAKRMTDDEIAQAQQLARECVAKDYKGC